MSHELESADAAQMSMVAVALPLGGRAERLIEHLSSHGFVVVAASGIERVAEQCDRDEPFVAIVDDSSAGWLRQVSDLLHERPNARPLALVDVESPAELLAAVGAGVTGFVSPSADLIAITRTVREVFERGAAIPRGLVPTLVDEVRRGRGRSVATAAGSIDVTEREWEILQLLLQRRSTREIADMLFVSVGTVRSHISALGRKIGATDREDTIRLLERRHG